MPAKRNRSIPVLVLLAASLVLAPAAWAGSHSHHDRGYLGVELDGLTLELRAHFGAPEDSGVLVSRVERESPAWEAGLEVGDVIVSVEGRRMESPWDVTDEVVDRPDETVRVEVVREGERRVLDVRLGSRVDHRHYYRRGIQIELDDEELEAELDRLGDHLESLGDEIGFRVERALEDVDWDEIGEVVERSLERSIRNLDGVRVEIDAREIERSLEALERSLEDLEYEIDAEVDVEGPAT